MVGVIWNCFFSPNRHIKFTNVWAVHLDAISITHYISVVNN